MSTADTFSYTFRASGLAGARGERWLFEELDLEILPGDLLEVTGPNGSGKTTLLRILAGLLPPACYLAVTLAVPVLNGAPARDAAAFLAHARAVLGGAAAVILFGFLVQCLASRLRSRMPTPNGSPIP